MANELLMIDIKASGLCDQSYPISIGVAGVETPRWSWLVYPLETWHHWDAKLEAQHGISRDQLLAQGRDGFIICKEMNAVFKGLTLACPTPRTKALLEKLYRELAIGMSFEVMDMRTAVGGDMYETIESNGAKVSLVNTAAQDAELYREALAANGIMHS